MDNAYGCYKSAIVDYVLSQLERSLHILNLFDELWNDWIVQDQLDSIYFHYLSKASESSRMIELFSSEFAEMSPISKSWKYSSVVFTSEIMNDIVKRMVLKAQIPVSKSGIVNQRRNRYESTNVITFRVVTK
jgi:hypothetical protein